MSGGGGTTISTSETRIEALSLQSSAYGVPIAVSYGVNRIAGNLVWYNGFKATPHTTTTSSGGGGGKGGGGQVTQSNTTYTYSSCVVMGIVEGQITSVPRIWKGKTVYTDGTTTALAQLGLSLATGAVGQAVWSYLTTNYASQAIGYSGVAYVYAQDYQLDPNAALDNHSFEVVSQYAYAVAGVPDANPSSIATDLLTNSRYGAGFPAGQIASWTSWANYCWAANLLLSPTLDQQDQAAKVISLLANLTNTAPVWTTGGLKMIPYGDASLTGNGATYTPNNTPIYDLTDDDFISDGSTDPITVTRKPQSEAFNCVKVEFLNRLNYYNIEVATAQDSANIDSFGLRVAPTIQAHWICNAATAQAVAQLALQRQLYIRNSYKFTLAWVKAYLEPMDLVTLTDSGLGFNKLPVRIIEVSESNGGDLDVVAEEFPLGVANAAIYSSQASAGFQHNYAVSGGSVAAPMIFEAPIQLTTTGLEVYAAIYGANANWGGCRVWVSLDGTNYKDKGMIYGPSRFGSITGAISAGAVPVQLNTGQLISGSTADAGALSTLCYIGGNSPEYFAYTTATLTGASAYSLSGLTRNAYSTNQSNSSHTSANPFARVDGSIAKSGPLDPSMVGKTIYMKFTSFNIYNAAEESLANVTAYPYTITGAMLYLPPSNVTGFAAATKPNGVIDLTWNDISDVDRLDFEIRVGSTWAAGTALTRTASLDYQIAPQAAGSYTYWVAARDNYFNYSPAPTSLPVTVLAPTAPTVSYAITGTDEYLTWTIPTGGSFVDRYEIRMGATWAAGTFVDTTKATGYRRTVDYVGSRTYWVAAIDVAGNYGTPASTTNSISAAPAPVSFVGALVGAQYQLAWSASVATSLPIRRYEIRYGSSYAAGTFVAQVDGTSYRIAIDFLGARTYWIAPIDTANNTGANTSTSITISAPAQPVISGSFVGSAAVLSWPTPTASLPIDYYTVTYGASRTPLGQISGNQISDTAVWGGTNSRTYFVKAFDVNGNASIEASFGLTSAALGAPTVSGSIAANDSNFKLTWTVPTGSLPVAYYEVFDGATSLGKTSALYFISKAYWSGSKTFSVVATDIAGVNSTAGTVGLTITAPAAPTVTAQVVDNNVLLYWTQPAATLPIDTFEIRRGASWAAGTLIGTKSGGFTTIFETAAGSYTYWIAAIDSVGNYGAAASVSSVVSQPPDYVLKANYTSTFSGTLSNAFLSSTGVLTLPVSTSQTFATHFTGNTWASPQDQINAGFPLYIQPSLTPAYYEEVIDYGTILASSRVTASWLLTTLAGTVSASCDISVSTDNISYTAYIGQSQVYAVNFRYIKVRITVTATSTAGIGTLSGLTVKLDSKLKTITGMVSAVSTDAGGTIVYMTDDRTSTGAKTFVDVDAIQLTPLGTSPTIAIYDFTDTPNPLSFKVLLFNTAGARVSGTVSYMVRGF